MWNQQHENLPLGGSAPRSRSNFTGTPSRRHGNGSVLTEPRRSMLARGISDVKDEAVNGCKSMLFADDDDVRLYRSSMHSSSPSKRITVLVSYIFAGSIIVIGFFIGSYYSSIYKSTIADITQERKNMVNLVDNLREAKDILSNAEERTRSLERERRKVLSKLDDIGSGNYEQHVNSAVVDAYGGADIYNIPVVSHGSTHFFIDPSSLPEFERKRRETAQLKRIDVLKSNIQKISKRELLDRFGPGPHRVEFTLSFFHSLEDFHPDELKPNTFVVETAPANLMPHSVLLFLEMVQHGLWDETAIVHNKEHVLTASPTNFFTGESKSEDFKKAGINQVSFQEYNEHYPHDKYTLGFAGRPGGPDFYISIEDNIQRHGPGGFADAAIVEEADPCFAKVIEGFDAVDRIYTEGVNTDLGVSIVGIISAQILPPKPSQMKLNRSIDSYEL